jgi:hypothetical protein
VVGPVGAITDLRNLMTGGGTVTVATAEHMLAASGFADVRLLDLPGGTALCAVRGTPSGDAPTAGRDLGDKTIKDSRLSD